nr:TlpA family protein disulfide reductase [Pseudopedobacter sp.]
MELSAQNLHSYKLITTKNDTLSRANLEEKIVLLNFWFIGCYPCMKEIPELNKIALSYKDRIMFIAISKDNSKEQINYFIKKFPFLFTQVLPNEELSKSLEITLYPTNILFNKDGKVVFKAEGYTENNLDSLKREIEKLIK